MNIDGLDFNGIRESMCRQYGIMEKSAAAPTSTLGRIANSLEAIGTHLKETAQKNPVKGILVPAAATAVGLTGAKLAYDKVKEKKAPLYKNILDPNTSAGQAALISAGLGGGLLGAHALNAYARSRQTQSHV